MEIGYLVKSKTFKALLTIAFIASPLIVNSSGYADDHGKVRIYKLNKKDQLVRLRRIKMEAGSVCNNQKKNQKAHRFALIGFKSCTVYDNKNCRSGDEVSALWGGGKYRSADIDISQPQTLLLEGTEWYFSSQENVTIRSWSCSY